MLLSPISNLALRSFGILSHEFLHSFQSLCGTGRQHGVADMPPNADAPPPRRIDNPLRLLEVRDSLVLMGKNRHSSRGSQSASRSSVSEHQGVEALRHTLAMVTPPQSPDLESS